MDDRSPADQAYGMTWPSSDIPGSVIIPSLRLHPWSPSPNFYAVDANGRELKVNPHGAIARPSSYKKWLNSPVVKEKYNPSHEELELLSKRMKELFPQEVSSKVDPRSLWDKGYRIINGKVMKKHPNNPYMK